jgi:hypothetical protein
MVRALLEGRKTQTRRVIKGVQRNNCLTVRKPTKTKTGIEAHVIDAGEHGLLPYAPGDRLWVREGFSGPYGCRNLPPRDWPNAGPIWHWADGNPEHGDWTRPKPGIHMPRWASRLTLTVTDVRVQRLQDISEDDARAEGVGTDTVLELDVGDMPAVRSVWNGVACSSHVDAMRETWAGIHGAGEWAANPWVCAVSFAVHKCNIDQVGVAA